MIAVELIRGLGFGGAERLLLHRIAAEQRDFQCVTEVVVNTHPGKNHYAPALEALGVHVLSPSSPSMIRSTLFVLRVLRETPADAVLISHSPTTSLILKAGRLIGRGERRLIVDVVHNSKFRWPVMLVNRLLNRQADLAIFVGQQIADAYTARGYRTFVVLHGGVPQAEMREWANEGAAKLRFELGVPPTARLLVAVGGLTEVKNHKLILEAMRDLDDQYELVLVGDGPQRSALQKLARDCGLKVTFLGWRADAWQVIAAADVLVHTSLYEGLPVVLMEAAALEVPMVVTAFQGADEVAASGAAISIAPTSSPSEVARLIQQAVCHEKPLSRGPSDYWSDGRYARDFRRLIRAATQRKHV